MGRRDDPDLPQRSRKARIPRSCGHAVLPTPSASVPVIETLSTRVCTIWKPSNEVHQDLIVIGRRFDGYTRNSDDSEERNLRLAATDLATVDKE